MAVMQIYVELDTVMKLENSPRLMIEVPPTEFRRLILTFEA